MNERVENLDIREFLLILKRHLKLIIFLPLFCCCTGFALAQWIISPRYESQAILVVNAAENSAGQSITYDQISAAQQLVNTYAIIFTSDTVLDQVISSLQLTINAERLAKTDYRREHQQYGSYPDHRLGPRRRDGGWYCQRNHPCGTGCHH